ncbi:MAG TPA: PRC-barrel domain-containing protein [Solirubrobacteraceae bacterium]|nr:PRC-barrel domain-containing protein [Solirubrobacteraceae bacterium]
MSDDGHAVSYNTLARGTPVRSSDGVIVGTVAEVLVNEREQIFDGLVIDTPHGTRFVDAPETARLAERAVTLNIDAAAVAALPERDHAGGPVYDAQPDAGRWRRLWRRRRD